MHKIQKTKMFNKYFAFFIASGLLVVFISQLIALYIFKSITYSLASENVSHMFDYISENVVNVTNECYDISNEIYTFNEEHDYNYIKLLYMSQNGLLSENQENQKYNLTMELLERTFERNPYIKSVMFIDSSYNAYVVGKNFDTNFDLSYSQNIRAIMESDEDFIFKYVGSQPYYTDNIGTLTFSQSVYYTNDILWEQQKVGIFVVDYYDKAFGGYFKNINDGVIDVLYLVDTNGRCIYSSNPAWNGISLFDVISNDNEMHSVKERYYYRQIMPYTNCILECRVDPDYYSSKISTIKTVIIISDIFCILLCIAIGYIGSRYFSKPVNSIVSVMRKVREGNLDVRIQMERNDEFGEISDNFNRTLDSLQDNINKIYNAEIEQNKAQMRALKAQIHPHFLYNTLEVIRVEALKNGAQTLSKMIEALGMFYKYLIHNDATFVTLDEEIMLLQRYYDLICFRYEKMIQLKITVKQEYRKVIVPKLILQPIVENAVKHSLKESGGSIDVSAKMDGIYLIITIKDNGCGMTQNDLEEVKQALEGSTELNTKGISSGIGLVNINNRIKLVGGNECGVSVSSIEGIGTSVKLKLKVN